MIASGRPATRRSVLLIGAGLIAWNLLMVVLGLWQSYWWAGLFGNFFLIVLLAEQIGHFVPARKKRVYERGLAIGFPIALLIAWELLVGAGILSARWFPPPSKVAGALWDLIVTYDEFSETTLLGRPWLIPQIL